MIRVLLLGASLTIASALSAQATPESEGDIFRITVAHETESKGEGSSSSSSGGHEYIERVIAVRSDGIERIFDLPTNPTEERKLIEWQFPVRVFEASNGDLTLLNREDMIERRDAWLSAAKLPQEACGNWYFTWNAFQVECDPEEILDTIKALDLQPPRLEDGQQYLHPAALEPGRISLMRASSDERVYRVLMPVDPDFFHRQEAESDVVVGEIMKEPVSFEDAFARRKRSQITGEIAIELVAAPNGRVWKRTTSIQTEKIDADGQKERSTSSEETERLMLTSSNF